MSSDWSIYTVNLYSTMNVWAPKRLAQFKVSFCFCLWSIHTLAHFTLRMCVHRIERIPKASSVERLRQSSGLYVFLWHFNFFVWMKSILAALFFEKCMYFSLYHYLLLHSMVFVDFSSLILWFGLIKANLTVLTILC